MLSVIMGIAIMLSVIIRVALLSVVMLSLLMVYVIWLRVVAPFHQQTLKVSQQYFSKKITKF